MNPGSCCTLGAERCDVQQTLCAQQPYAVTKVGSPAAAPTATLQFAWFQAFHQAKHEAPFTVHQLNLFQHKHHHTSEQPGQRQQHQLVTPLYMSPHALVVCFLAVPVQQKLRHHWDKHCWGPDNASRDYSLLYRCNVTFKLVCFGHVSLS